jgi:CRP/FNR family cyclic AMP-dependent transcriptional regulator
MPKIQSTSSSQKSAPPPDAATFDAELLLTSIGTGRANRKLKAREPVFRQGDAADAVFYVEKGKIQIRVTSKQGKEAIIAVHARGDFFGEGCLIGQPLRLATAVATTAAAVTRIEKASMVRILMEQPHISAAFMAFLLSRNMRIEADLVDQMFNSSEQRLARLLLLLANFAKEGEMQPVVAKVNQDVLAARVGTTRSRINHFMNKFRKLGYIEYNGTLKVHTSLLNLVIHD